MNHFLTRPGRYRLFYILLMIVLIFIAIKRTYHHVVITTDENLFEMTPSQVMFTKSIIDSTTIPQKVQVIQPSDLVIRINQQKATDYATARRILNALADGEKFAIDVLRPQQLMELKFSVSNPAIIKQSIRKIPPALLVKEISKNGASDRAGIKIGDIILKINNRVFLEPDQTTEIFYKNRSGNSLTYDIIRGNNRINLPVKLASFGFSLNTVISILCFLAFVGVGSFLILKNPENEGVRYLSLAFSLIGLAFIRLPAWRRFFVFFDEYAFIYVKTSAILFGSAFWCLSEYYFPKEIPNIINRSWIRYVYYFIIAVTLMLILIISPNVWKIQYVAISLTVMLMFHLIVSQLFQQEIPVEYRKLDRLVFWVILISLIPMFITVFILRDYLTLSMLPLIIIPFVYLYIIGRYHLLDIKLNIRQSIKYTLFSVAWKTVCVLLLIILLFLLPKLPFNPPDIKITDATVEVLDSPMVKGQRDAIFQILLMIISIFSAFFIWKIERYGIKFLDDKYYRTQDYFLRTSNEITEVITNQLSIPELAQGIVRKIAVFMHIKRTALIVYNRQQKSCYNVASGLSGNDWEDYAGKISQILIDIDQSFRTDTRISIDYLSGKMKEELFNLGIRHLIPIRSNNKLLAVLFLGEKKSETPFHQEDLSFLTGIAKQLSVAFENAFLYKELATQERIKHELEIARQIQMSSLPQRTPSIRGLEISGISLPALEVGGDYYDFLNGSAENEQVTIIVGDVSGKGTSAALYMSKVQGILHSLHSFHLSPRELFIRANKVLCHDLEKKSFVTAIGAFFKASERKTIIARAGHLPLFYYQARTRRVTEIIPTGLGLALDDTQLFARNLEEIEIDYEIGDVFLFITDGITEVYGIKGEEFGETNVKNILAQYAGQEVSIIKDQIIQAVKDFAGAQIPQQDDQTVVVVKAVN